MNWNYIFKSFIKNYLINWILLDDICYIANTGDSRSILSKCSGDIIEQLTNDHKPNQKSEESRILQAGGKVYQ